MFVYRIAKTFPRANDISGTGAYQYGGRWNSKGTYMLYTSENSSLAYLENLVHFDQSVAPATLFIARLEVKAEESLFYKLPDITYPVSWQQLDNFENKLMGDSMSKKAEFLAVKVRSAVNPMEFNYLLNPLFPAYHDLVKMNRVERIEIDTRLIYTA
jgi:RES domain-containing protein